MNSKIILSILVSVIGLLALINPQASIEAIVILIGLGAVFNGIFYLTRAKQIAPDRYFLHIIRVRSVVGIAVGVFAVVLPFALFNAIQAVIRVFLYIQAIYLLLFAIAEFAIAVKSDFAARSALIEAFSSLFVAVLLFLLPADFGTKIVRIAGAVIFVCGIVFAIREWRARPKQVEAEVVSSTPADSTSN